MGSLAEEESPAVGSLIEGYPAVGSLAEENEEYPTSGSKHIYENFVSEETTTRAIVHQESLEHEAFLTQEEDSPSYSPQMLEGDESPPLDCNKTLLSSKSDRTM